MTNPANTIGDAFYKLRRSIYESDAHDWASIELKDVWAEICKIQHDIIQKQKHLAGLVRQSERSVRTTQLRHSIEWLAVDDNTQEENLARLFPRRHNETCQCITLLYSYFDMSLILLVISPNS